LSSIVGKRSSVAKRKDVDSTPRGSGGKSGVGSDGDIEKKKPWPREGLFDEN